MAGPKSYPGAQDLRADTLDRKNVQVQSPTPQNQTQEGVHKLARMSLGLEENIVIVIQFTHGRIKERSIT